MNPRLLADPLHQLAHAYQSHMRRALRAAGVELPPTHVRALKGIALTPQCTAQSLTVYMRSDKAQITRVLNDLLAAALIVKHDNPDDGRSRLLELSSSGQAVLKHAQALESAVGRQMTEGLSSDEVDIFLRTAQRITDNLNGAQHAV